MGVKLLDFDEKRRADINIGNIPAPKFLNSDKEIKPQ